MYTEYNAMNNKEMSTLGKMERKKFEVFLSDFERYDKHGEFLQFVAELKHKAENEISGKPYNNSKFAKLCEENPADCPTLVNDYFPKIRKIFSNMPAPPAGETPPNPYKMAVNMLESNHPDMFENLKALISQSYPDNSAVEDRWQADQTNASGYKCEYTCEDPNCGLKSDKEMKAYCEKLGNGECTLYTLTNRMVPD